MWSRWLPRRCSLYGSIHSNYSRGAVESPEHDGQPANLSFLLDEVGSIVLVCFAGVWLILSKWMRKCNINKYVSQVMNQCAIFISGACFVGVVPYIFILLLSLRCSD